MDTIRRFPGLRCEHCGSDKFKIELYLTQGNEITGSEEYQHKMYLTCARCPRVFPICSVRRMSDISELPQNFECAEISLNREKID